jgi:hypothetical protein
MQKLQEDEQWVEEIVGQQLGMNPLVSPGIDDGISVKIHFPVIQELNLQFT